MTPNTEAGSTQGIQSILLIYSSEYGNISWWWVGTEHLQISLTYRLANLLFLDGLLLQ
jgi:hypothetical protein